MADGSEEWRRLTLLFEARLCAGVHSVLGAKRFAVAREQADDLLQDVYCHLLRRQGRALAQFRGHTDAELGQYLYLTARRVVIDRLRYLSAEKRGGLRVVCEGHGEGSPGEMAVDGRPGPERRLLAAEQWRGFEKDCRRVVGPRHRQRDLLVLSYSFCFGFSTREISEMLPGLSESGVDSIIFRARSRLRKLGQPLPKRMNKRRSRESCGARKNTPRSRPRGGSGGDGVLPRGPAGSELRT